MRPGRLNKRVEILRSVQSSDGQGGYSETWTIALTRYADWIPGLSKERFSNDKTENPLEGIFRVRYTSQILESDRVRYKGVEYEIVSLINKDDQDKELEIGVRKVVT